MQGSELEEKKDDTPLPPARKATSSERRRRFALSGSAPIFLNPPPSIGVKKKCATAVSDALTTLAKATGLEAGYLFAFHGAEVKQFAKMFESHEAELSAVSVIAILLGVVSAIQKKQTSHTLATKSADELTAEIEGSLSKIPDAEDLAKSFRLYSGSFRPERLQDIATVLSANKEAIERSFRSLRSIATSPDSDPHPTITASLRKLTNTSGNPENAIFTFKTQAQSIHSGCAREFFAKILAGAGAFSAGFTYFTALLVLLENFSDPAKYSFALLGFGFEAFKNILVEANTLYYNMTGKLLDIHTLGNLSVAIQFMAEMYPRYAAALSAGTVFNLVKSGILLALGEGAGAMAANVFLAAPLAILVYVAIRTRYQCYDAEQIKREHLDHQGREALEAKIGQVIIGQNTGADKAIPASEKPTFYQRLDGIDHALFTYPASFLLQCAPISKLAVWVGYGARLTSLGIKVGGFAGGPEYVTPTLGAAGAFLGGIAQGKGTTDKKDKHIPTDDPSRTITYRQAYSGVMTLCSSAWQLCAAAANAIRWPCQRRTHKITKTPPVLPLTATPVFETTNPLHAQATTPDRGKRVAKLAAAPNE